MFYNPYSRHWILDWALRTLSEYRVKKLHDADAMEVSAFDSMMYHLTLAVKSEWKAKQQSEFSGDEFDSAMRVHDLCSNPIILDSSYHNDLVKLAEFVKYSQIPHSYLNKIIVNKDTGEKFKVFSVEYTGDDVYLYTDKYDRSKKSTIHIDAFDRFYDVVE